MSNSNGSNTPKKGSDFKKATVHTLNHLTWGVKKSKEIHAGVHEWHNAQFGRALHWSLDIILVLVLVAIGLFVFCTVCIIVGGCRIFFSRFK